MFLLPPGTDVFRGENTVLTRPGEGMIAMYSGRPASSPVSIGHAGAMFVSPVPPADPCPVTSFVHGLIRDVIERHGNTGVPATMLRPAQDFMDAEWELFCRRSPGPYLLAEGCAVSGLEAGLHDGRLMFRWRTSFYPRPRHPSPETDICPLGFHGDVDLYIACHDGRPPEMVCRFGSGDKSTYWPLEAPLPEPPGPHEQALREGLSRAAAANALWGGDLAAPAPLGSVAVPQRSVRKKNEQ